MTPHNPHNSPNSPGLPFSSPPEAGKSLTEGNPLPATLVWPDGPLEGTYEDPAAILIVRRLITTRASLCKFLVDCADEMEHPERLTEEDRRIHAAAMVCALDQIPNGKDIKPYASPVALRLLASLVNPPEK